MSTRLRLAALVLLCVGQLVAAGWSIARYESVLASGTPFKIRVAPIDPADAFRGRYVAVEPSIMLPLPVDADTEAVLDALQSERGTAYVILATDPDGFASAAAIVRDRPEAGDYLKIERAWPTWSPRAAGSHEVEQTGYTLVFSFNRYYMNETAAPAAEERHREAARRDADSTAWLSVRVRNGIGVIDGLFIDGTAIEELVRP